MTEVLLKCAECDDEIAVDMDAAVLRMDVEPRARAELLFCCPSCQRPGLRLIGAELLSLLLFVGVEPLRLSEPSLPVEDQAPGLSPLSRDDLLTWHEQLARVQFVTPWEQ